MFDNGKHKSIRDLLIFKNLFVFFAQGGIKISLTGASNLASLALTSTSPLAALSELDDPTTIPTTGPEGTLIFFINFHVLVRREQGLHES